LQELKDIIVRYYPEKGNDLLTSALFDIITCERDLRAHCLAEEDIFIPAVSQLEHKIEEEEQQNAKAAVRKHDKDSDDEDTTQPTDAEKLNTLSDREREIVKLIAKGLTNKEIANQLYLSVHTVATHRRNITGKLQIHSPAGLTIFAIVNGLLPLNEIPRDRIQ
jgi:regulator of cell morphogenesis and NO signaling